MSILDNFRMPEIKIPSFSESFMTAAVEKIRAMEASLKPDQNLSVVCYTASREEITVAQLQFTHGMVIVVHGYDPGGNPTYIVSSAFALQLVCRITKAEVGAKKKPPIGFEFKHDESQAANEISR